MTAAAPIDPKYVSLLWAGPDQADAVAALHKQLFDPPWDEAGIRALLDHPASTAFVAMIGNPKTAVGFVMGQLAADEAEILSIGVAKDWQRKGIGRRLVDGLARAVARAEVKRVFLEVAADNAAAVALYRRLGFTETGRRKGYYERKGKPPVDALRLTLTV
jgi:ribosomal-protein-alanine N-acetyltransferase